MKKFTNLLLKEIKELVTKQLVFSLVFTMALFYFIGEHGQDGGQEGHRQPEDLRPRPGRLGALPALWQLKSARFEPIDRPGKTDAGRRRRPRRARRTSCSSSPRASANPWPVRAQGDRDLRLHPKLLHRRDPALRGPPGRHRGHEQLPLRRFPQEEASRTSIPEASRTRSRPRTSSSSRTRWPKARPRPSPGSSPPRRCFIPIILMMIIIYSSQMVISAIAMEKQNKTLETLLTVPIPRTSIVTAKMLAAASSACSRRSSTWSASSLHGRHAGRHRASARPSARSSSSSGCP